MVILNHIAATVLEWVGVITFVITIPFGLVSDLGLLIYEKLRDFSKGMSAYEVDGNDK